MYVFFVHTCLVLMWSLERNPHTLNFYVRRIFRIYPLAMVIVLATFLLGFPPDHGNEMHYIPLIRGGVRGLADNLALVQNFFGGRSIAGVTWSLPMEIDMYIFLPVLFAFTSRERALWPLLLIWAATAALLCTVYRDPGPMGNDFAVLIPDFLPGVIAYVGFRIRRPVLPVILLPALLAVLCFIVLYLPGRRYDWGACLVLGLTLPLFRQVQNHAVKKLSKIVAQYSYGIYLTHPFGIFFGIHLLSGRSAWVQIPVELAVIGLMSFAGYHLIEHRFIELGKRVAKRIEAFAGVDNLDAPLEKSTQ